jgi:hypothetical protein
MIGKRDRFLLMMKEKEKARKIEEQIANEGEIYEEEENQIEK